MGRTEEELLEGGSLLVHNIECEILGDILGEAAAGWAWLVSREGIWAGERNWGPTSF